MFQISLDMTREIGWQAQEWIMVASSLCLLLHPQLHPYQFFPSGDQGRGGEGGGTPQGVMEGAEWVPGWR